MLDSDRDFYTKVAQMAELTDEATLVKLLTDATYRYNNAKYLELPVDKVDNFYLDIKVLSYVILIKSLGFAPCQFLKEIESIERVLKLIHPPIN